MLVAVGDDIGCQRAVQAGNAREQGHRGGVDVNADGVDAVFDDGVERFCQPCLADIVLILADADRFGLDLDEFSKRVLQTAGDGNRAAQADIQFGKFARGVFGSRIDRGARFRNDDLGQMQFRQHFDQIAGQPVGFARGGAVADADELNGVFFCQHGQCR